MFSYGVNRHSTTSATFSWNYHFTYIQIIFILPLRTFHILRICDDYHHFLLTTRSHSNWPHEFGLRWLMLVCLYVISQHHNWDEILTARFAYSLTQHFLHRSTIEIIWNWRKTEAELWDISVTLKLNATNSDGNLCEVPADDHSGAWRPLLVYAIGKRGGRNRFLITLK